MHLGGAEFIKSQTKGLAEPAAATSLGATAERSAKHNREVTDAVPYFQDWREAAHQIKSYAIANLDKLPAAGATIFIGAPKHRPGTGGPACRRPAAAPSGPRARKGTAPPPAAAVRVRKPQNISRCKIF